MNIERDYNYSDVYLVPQKRIVNSRSECDISVTLGNRSFSNPVIPANMQTVVDWKTCQFFGSKNMFYIMHRFHQLNSSELIQKIGDLQDHCGYASISVGVHQRDRNHIIEMRDELREECYPEYITIDVAHAYSNQVVEMIEFIKRALPKTYLIVGNVGTADAVTFLEDAGADAVKVFIGPGAACTTKVKTGFTRGTVSCLLECAEVAKVPLIADGGIRECGDIAKAMACGSTMVMAGMFMCGFDESPGEIMQVNGHLKYLYYGSASYNMKKNNKHIEGTDRLIDYKGSMEKHINDIECSLKSSVSYAGVKCISDMYGTPLRSIN